MVFRVIIRTARLIAFDARRFFILSLVVLDFDVLTSKLFGCDYKGKNAPVVYSIVENSLETKTFSTIFESWETAGLLVNIYFPIDFANLQLVNKLVTGKDCTLNKFNYFMNEYSVNNWCESKLLWVFCCVLLLTRLLLFLANLANLVILVIFIN